MITLSLLTAALVGAQDTRVSDGLYHTMPDVRRTPTAAQLAPAASPSASPREAAGPRPAPAAQDTPTAERAAAAVRQTLPPSLQFDVDNDGRHWARGANFKASFGTEGAAFIPFLGSDAPRNFPVEFALARAAQGGNVAPLATPVVTRAGERVVLDQGAVRSEYVVGLQGLEQLFVLDAPLGTGDLVLDLGVTSELTLAQDGAGWRFENAFGAVSYGAAFVLDAAGRRLDLATDATGEGFRFTVPAEFLAGATWPIAVDPLIALTTIDTDTIDQLQVDVAYDPTTNQYLVAFEEVFSAADHDIQSWLIDGAGNLVPGSSAFIDFTTLFRSEPRIAMTNVRRTFLCAYTEGAAAPRRIGARGRNADTSAIGASFIVDDNTAGDRFSPDICGDAYTASINDAHYTIVWRRYWAATDSDVVVRVVNEDGTLLTGELYVTNIIGISDEQPSISKCISPGTNDSVVVWRRGGEILASMVSYDGGAVRSEFSLASSFSPLSGPQVSGLSSSNLPGSVDPTFVACWDTDYTSDRDIEGVVASASNFVGNTATVSATQFISFMEHVDYFLDQREPDIACMGDRWVITQNAVYPGFTDYVIRATTVNIVGLGLGVSERFEALTTTFDETLTPKTASRHEAGSAGDLEAFTGWIQQATFGQPGDVHGALHGASAANTCAAQYVFCTGNPNGTFTDYRSFLWVEGDFSTTGSKRLHALDVHVNAFGYFLTSLTAQGGITPPGSAGVLCLGGTIGRYSNFVLNSGGAGSFFLDINPGAISQPTGPVSAMAGQTWFFQAWHRDVNPAGGPPTSNFTNAAGIPFQ